MKAPERKVEKGVEKMGAYTYRWERKSGSWVVEGPGPVRLEVRGGKEVDASRLVDMLDVAYEAGREQGFERGQNNVMESMRDGR